MMAALAMLNWKLANLENYEATKLHARKQPQQQRADCQKSRKQHRSKIEWYLLVQSQNEGRHAGLC